MCENEQILWKYDAKIKCYVIYYDRPMPKPYVGDIIELWRLEMKENQFNNVVVREIVDTLNFRK